MNAKTAKALRKHVGYISCDSLTREYYKVNERKRTIAQVSPNGDVTDKIVEVFTYMCTGKRAEYRAHKRALKMGLIELTK